MIKVKFLNIINKKFYNLQKLVAVFVFVMVLLNSFIPKNQEIKSNFMSAFNCAVNTVQTNFYDEYSNVVMSVINSILSNFNIEMIAEAQLSEQQAQQKDGESSTPVNTSADNAIIIQTGTSNQIETLNLNLSYLIYESKNKLYDVCGNIGVNFGNRATNMGILFFVLFAILVVRIKDTIAVILNKKYRKLNRLA